MTPTLLRPLAEADLIDRAAITAEKEASTSPSGSSTPRSSPWVRSAGCLAPGSPRVGEICGIAGLRARRIVGFPCGWFYFVAAHHIDVVRLLADAQDLPTNFADIEPE